MASGGDRMSAPVPLAVDQQQERVATKVSPSHRKCAWGEPSGNRRRRLTLLPDDTLGEVEGAALAATLPPMRPVADALNVLSPFSASRMKRLQSPNSAQFTVTPPMEARLHYLLIWSRSNTTLQESLSKETASTASLSSLVALSPSDATLHPEANRRESLEKLSANELMDRGMFQLAAAKCRVLLEEDPDNVRVRRLANLSASERPSVAMVAMFALLTRTQVYVQRLLGTHHTEDMVEVHAHRSDA